MASIGGNKIGVTALCAIVLATFLLNTPDSVQSFRLDSASSSVYDDSKAIKSAYFSKSDAAQEEQDSESICAQTCSQTDSNRLIEYQQGQTYTYKVQLSTGLSTDNTARGSVADSNKYGDRLTKSSLSTESSKVVINAIADMSVYGPCEMVLRLRKVSIDGIENQEEVEKMKSELERQSTHFSYENGQIGDVCSEQDEQKWIVNIKKSILSTIQMSAKSLEEKSSIVETDINGQCQTEYEPINSWKYGLSNDKKTTVMLKTKNLAKCNKRHQINIGLFPRSYGLDQVIRSSMPIINSTYECRQKIQDLIVIEAQCCDKQTIWPLNVLVDSDIRVQLIDQQQGLVVPKSQSINGFERENLGWMSSYQSKSKIFNSQQQRRQQYSVQDVEQLLQQICKNVQDSVQIQVPEQFSELVRQKQSLSVEDEQRLYRSIQSGSLCSSSKLVDIYLDASALAGTEGSVQVLIDAYQQQQQQQQPRPEDQLFSQRFSYLFSMLAFAKNPTYPAAQRLVQFVQQQQQQIQQQQQPEQQEDFNQIVLGVTGFVHNLRQQQQQQDQDEQQHSGPEQQQIDSLVQQFQQYLIGQLEQCIQQVGQQQQVNVSTCVTLARGIENVGLQIETNYQQQQQLVQKLVELIQKYSQQQQQQSQQQDDLSDAIPVAILQSIVDVIDDQTRDYLIREIVVNEQQPTQVRIEAYKTVVMSGAKISQLESIQRYVDSVEERFEDLVNYVRSHQANLRSTSDLHRRTVLPLGAPEFKQPSGQVWGVSRNYELSYLNDVYQMGVTAETDVIFRGQQQQQQNFRHRYASQQYNSIPQVVQFNLTVPVMGRELQAVQIRVQQTGLDQVFGDDYSSSSSSSQKTAKNPLAIVSRLIDVVVRQASVSNKSRSPQQPVQLLIQVSVDGKTIVLVDQDQLVSYVTGQSEIAQFFQKIFQQGQRQVSIDRAFSFIPIDFEASTVTSNGLPIQVQVNSSVVVGFKTEANVNIGSDARQSQIQFSVWPSIASQLEARVQYQTGSQTKSIQYMTRVYSAPNVNLKAQLNGQDGVDFKWDMPQQKYTLIRYESNFRVNDQEVQQSNERRQQEQTSGFGFAKSLIGSSSSSYSTGSSSSSSSSYGRNYRQRRCTDFTKKPLGVALCYDASYQNDEQQSQWMVEMSVEKFDRQLNSFEIRLDNPLSYFKWIKSGFTSDSDETESSVFDQSSSSVNKRHSKRSLKFVFNTPGSQIDRELAFEVELPTFDHESGLLKEARLRIQSPWKKIIAQAVARNQEHERVVSVELSVDEHKYFQMELGLELMKRGQKMEYRSKMILASPIMAQPINLVGIWSYQQGRKTALFVSLEDVQQNRHYIKATFAKIGQMSTNDLKASAHAMIDLAGCNAKVTGTLERSARDLKLEVSTDYATALTQPQSARLSLKHQNLSWGKMIKFVNQGSWSWTVAPQYDAQYHHSITIGTNEFFEHDLQMGWNNDQEQVKAYQLTKLAGQRGRYDVESQTILTIKPLKINYQVDAQSSLIGFGSTNGQKQYKLIAIGHSRDSQVSSSSSSQDDKIRAELSYEQETEQPLKMKMRATVKSSTIDFIYSDDIEEKQENNFNGHLMIQLNPMEKYTADYVYSIDKNTNDDEYKHQIDVTLNDDIRKRLAGKQQAKFHLISNNLLDLKTKFTDENDRDIFDGQLKLDRNGPSNCRFEHQPSETKTKIDISPYSTPAFGKIQFQNRDKKHSSNLEYEQGKALKFDSKTEQNGENVFSIDSEIRPKHKSHVTFDSDAFSGDCQYDDSASDNSKSGRIQFRLPESWSHDSKVSYQPEQGRYEVDSRTEYQDKTVADFQSKYDHGKEFEVELETPTISTGFSADKVNNKYDARFKNDKYDHKTKLTIENQQQQQPKTIRFESKTDKNGKNVATVSYNCDNDHVHQVHLDCDDMVKARGECQLKSDSPYAKVDFDWLDSDKPISHQTEIRANRQEQSVNVHSKTRLSNEKLAEIKAAIARNPIDRKTYGSMKMDLPQFDAEADYEQQPESDVEHQISFAMDGKRFLQDLKHKTILKIKKRSIFDIKSETKSKKDHSNYLDLEGQYRHEDEHQPSNIDLKLGEIFQTGGKFNFFNKEQKSIDMSGKYQDKDGRKYQHETKAQYEPMEKSMKIDSKISNEIGKNIASIKSELSKKSDQIFGFFLLDSDDTKQIPKIKLDVNQRKKRAAIDIDMDDIQHHSMYQNDQTALKVNTITSKNQKNIFNFNTEINRQPNSKSSVQVQVGPQHEAAFHLYPEQQSGVFSLQTPSVRHSTEFDLNRNQVGQPTTVQSSTYYHNNLLADVDARLEGVRGENVIKANVPSLVRLDSTLDLPGKRASFDAQSDWVGGRHLMGSVYGRSIRPSSVQGEGKEFHFDFAWDVDRDPRSRVSVDVSAQRQSDQSVVASAQINYAHNKLTLTTEVTPRSILAKSARVSLSYQPYDGQDSWEVIYSHINRVPQVECKLELLLRQQVRYSARLTTQITEERFAVGFQTTSPQNIDAQINLNVIGVQQGQGQYYLKVTMQRAVEDQYEIVATAQQDADYRIFVGKVEFRLPHYETQTMEYRVDLPGRVVSVYLVNPQNGRQFQLNGQVQEDLAQLVLKSNVPYLPIVDGKIRYVPNEEFYANLDVDQERLVEMQYKQTGFDSVRSGRMYLLAKFQSVFTPSLELSAQSSQQQQQQDGQQNGLVITVEGKYNVETILYGQLKQISTEQDTLGQQSISFVVKGWLSRPNGVKLIEAVSKFVVGGQDQSVIDWVLDIEPNRNELETIEPVYVVVSAQRKPVYGQSVSAQKLVGSVKVSHGQERRDWIDADLVVESTQQVYDVPVPERIVATVRYVPTSTQATFEISIMERLNEDRSSGSSRSVTLFDDQEVQPQLKNLRIVRKYRNQLLASLDDRKIGFELITNQMGYRNTYEHSLKLYSPQPSARTVQYRTAYHYSPETLTYFYRSELKSGYSQSVEPIYQSTTVFGPIVNKPTSYMVYYDVRSPVLLGGDGQVQARVFVFGPENKYQGVIASLRTSQNDQVTFEATARTEEQQSNQLVYYGQSNKVTYYNVSLYTEDQTVDSGVDGQVSGSGLVFNWHHQNRMGRPESGSYKLQLLENNQFEAQMEHGTYGYNVQGQYRSKQGVWVLDGLVDEYQWVSQQRGRRPTTRSVVNQYKIHVEAKDQCIRANVEGQQQQQQVGQESVQQFSLCMDEDQSNILNLAVDSIVNGQKTTDLNVRLDTRQVSNSVILSFKWNPRYERTFLGQMLQRFTSVYDQTEVVSEIGHVVRVLSEKFSPIYGGRSVQQYQAFVEQLVQIFSDFGVDVYELRQVVSELVLEPIWEVFGRITHYVYEYVSSVDQIYTFVRRLVRSVEQQCYDNESCRQVMESFVSIQSLEQLIETISERIVLLLQHTHRIISTSYSGRWMRNLIPTTWMDYLPNLIHQLNYYFVNSYAKMIQGNYPLAELLENFEHILHEMIDATHWRSVQWNQVKNAVEKIIQITLSPLRYSTSSRVLVYDPKQGQLQVELYGPAVKHPRYYFEKYNDITNNKSLRSVGGVGNYYYGGDSQQQQQQAGSYSQYFSSFFNNNNNSGRNL